MSVQATETPNTGEWVIWNGGRCPVRPDSIVRVQLAGETRLDAARATPVAARTFRWNAEGIDSDIVAYQVIEYAPALKGVTGLIRVDPGDGVHRLQWFGTPSSRTRAMIEVAPDGTPLWNTLRVESVK